MKKVVLFFALIVGLLASASTMQAQTVNMSRYITLTVEKDSAIKLDFRAASAGTTVRIVSGSNTRDITIGTNWYGRTSYTAGSTTMTVYGDITDFNCRDNGANLTALDPSHNTQLTELSCYSNSLSSLDVSHNTQLEILNCNNNILTALDLSKNTQLTMLYCGNNKLSSLDVSHNTQLEILSCNNNILTALDLSKNTQLTMLYCGDNKLSSLDVSNNTQLEILSCKNNILTALDLSQNTKLTKLYCYDNNFTTAALDHIYCALPDRTGVEAGKIVPIVNASSSNAATVAATTKSNATSKNWKVQYYADTDIPATTGTYVCGSSPQPNMNSYITLTVAKDSAIRLDFKAAAAGTPVRIVSGSNTQDITVGTGWTGYRNYTAGSTTMTVYGDIISFDCSDNITKVTAIDVSHNTQLKELWCQNNTLNRLDVSGCTQLTNLSCQNNNLTTLDVSKNTQLTKLSCRKNNLTTLDVSKNTKLTTLYCHGNNLSTQALDDIFCALPDRTGNTNGKIQPVYNSSSSNHATVLATNAANATAKNWKVQYYKDDTDIPATTGKHKCSATDIAEAAAEPALTLYPNPVADVLYLSATARTIRIYNVYGTEVAHAYDTDRVDVASLPTGVYTVKADGTVAKMVKR